MNTSSKQYVVGYGRPPEHSKWKKGQCGNPARIRKRIAKPIVAMIDEFFASEHIVSGKRCSAFEIILVQLSNKAIAGNSRALRTEAESFNEVMNQVIEYRQGGKVKRATRAEFLIVRTGTAALRGDVSAAANLLKLRETFEKLRDVVPIFIPLTEADTEIFGGLRGEPR
jgi:hypothetical protein